MSRRLCPLCQSTKITIIITSPQVPVHCNLLWPGRDQARQAPRGDIDLGFCEHCGHIYNFAFDPAAMTYTQAYENSLHYSPRFQQYADSLARHLIDQYALHHKTVLEIGCGQGDFLKLLCRLGPNQGFGFDPSYMPPKDDAADQTQITFIQDFYSDRYGQYQGDLICCRHVLEHIQAPVEFIRNLSRTINDSHRPAIYFEVPNVLYTLRDLGIWDLIYEHCSYFSQSSLGYLFAQSGFEICHLTEAYGGQFLGLEARPVRQSSDPTRYPDEHLPALKSLTTAFAHKYREKVAAWQQALAHLAAVKRRVVAWGAGSKGVTFLNILKTQEQIEYIIDINPRKQGMFVAGTGQQIVPPEFLLDYRPEAIILMNPLYREEIRQTVARLGLSPEFMVV